MIMVEQGMAVEGYHPYPPSLATYEAVVGSRELFMDSLKKLHGAMGTKFMIPIVGGKDLDLHRLFVEVTSRGGITKVVKERKWKEVTAVFSFPSSATNASFILRKYYISLLYHYEQIYFFKAKCWTPLSTDALQNVSTITAPPHGLTEHILSPQNHETSRQLVVNTATFLPEVTLTPSPFIPVSGVIDGKFDGGYLITVKIGTEDFKGVLYQVLQSEAQELSQHHSVPAVNMNQSSSKPVAPRRNRRKKSEIRRRDPAHPKPNRSGYNFFFAEQHSRLKPLYPGRDRDISKMIGELWNKIKEPERSVYQEKALRDKERYRLEMEEYRKRLRTGQIIKNADAVLNDLDKNVQTEGETYLIAGIETSSDKSILEGYEKADEESEAGVSMQAEMELKNVNVEIALHQETSELPAGQEVGRCDESSPGRGQIIKNAVLVQQFPSIADTGLLDLDKNVQSKGYTSDYTAEKETSSKKRKLKGYEIVVKGSGSGSGSGPSSQDGVELQDANVKTSADEAVHEMRTGAHVVGYQDINNAVPMPQFPPVADFSLMDLHKSVQTEGDTSACMAENEKSPSNSNFLGFGKAGKDSRTVASTQEQVVVGREDMNVAVEVQQFPSNFQTGLKLVGCEGINNAVPVQQSASKLQTGPDLLGCVGIDSAVSVQQSQSKSREGQDVARCKEINSTTPVQQSPSKLQTRGDVVECEDLICAVQMQQSLSKLQTGQERVGCEDINISVPVQQSPLELQTERDVVGSEDIKSAAPVKQFTPMAYSVLMDLQKNIQNEGETSAHMAENETFPIESNLEGYEGNDSGTRASFQDEIELKNVNINISPDEEAPELQMRIYTSGLNDKNPEDCGMEEMKMLSTGGDKNLVSVEGKTSVQVEEIGVGFMNINKSVATSKGNESPGRHVQ